MHKPFDKILVSAALSLSLMTPLSLRALPLDARSDPTAITDTCEVAGLPQDLASVPVRVPTELSRYDSGGGDDAGSGGDSGGGDSGGGGGSDGVVAVPPGA